MCITFFKWMQYLQRRDVSKFLDLYSKNCIIVPILEKPERKSLINPYCGNITLHTRVGVFKNFEDILFTHYREFKIFDHTIMHSNESTLLAECNFFYKGYNFNTTHNMTFTKENTTDKIIYHCTRLKRINEL